MGVELKPRDGTLAALVGSNQLASGATGFAAGRLVAAPAVLVGSAAASALGGGEEGTATFLSLNPPSPSSLPAWLHE